MQSTFGIGDLAREFGITHRTLRFYEDKGLISPRREGQNRIYSRRDRARLGQVILGRKVGFSLAEIGEMLDFYDLKGGEPAQLQVALTRFGEQIRVLERQKHDVEQAIGALRQTVEIVSGMLRDRRAAGTPVTREPAPGSAGESAVRVAA